MSKKKGKSAARQASKKSASKKKATTRKSVRASASRTLGAYAEPQTPRTKTANIFIFKTGAGSTKIRTSPQRLYANPGDHVEFNVVNMIDDGDVPVTIEFADGGPWGRAPFEIRSWQRKSLIGAQKGRFKYTVRALDAIEDPEIELPEGN